MQALAGEAATAQTQAEHAAELARMNETQAAAVNAFLDRLLETRLGALERQARRREWGYSPLSWLWLSGSPRS